MEPTTAIGPNLQSCLRTPNDNLLESILPKGEAEWSADAGASSVANATTVKEVVAPAIGSLGQDSSQKTAHMGETKTVSLHATTKILQTKETEVVQQDQIVNLGAALYTEYSSSSNSNESFMHCMFDGTHRTRTNGQFALGVFAAGEDQNVNVAGIQDVDNELVVD